MIPPPWTRLATISENSERRVPAGSEALPAGSLPAGSDQGKPLIIKRKRQKLGANSALDTGFSGRKQAAKAQRADYGVRELAPALRPPAG